MTRPVLASLVLGLTLGNPAIGQSIVPLRPAAGDLSALPTAMSPDGSVFAGVSYSGPGGFGTPRAVRWTAAGGPGAALTSSPPSTINIGGISADGLTVVGSVGGQAARWNAGGLNYLPAGSAGTSHAAGVSADGTVISGTLGSGNAPAAAQWVNGSLRTLPTGTRGGPLTPDGQTMVGVYRDPANTQPGTLFRWSEPTGVQPLAGGTFTSDFLGVAAITPDASVVLANLRHVGSTNHSSFLWSGGTTQDLGFLPGMANNVAFAMNAGATLVGGYCSMSFGAPQAAYLWSAQSGIQTLAQWLAGHGVDTGGWTLQSVRGISADGLTIMGYGIDPVTGQQTGFAVTVPSPPTLLAIVGACAAISRRRRRSSLKSACCR